VRKSVNEWIGDEPDEWNSSVWNIFVPAVCRWSVEAGTLNTTGGFSGLELKVVGCCLLTGVSSREETMSLEVKIFQKKREDQSFADYSIFMLNLLLITLLIYYES